MNTTGIWIDKEKAHVVTLTDKEENMQTVFSKIEDFHVQGGSGTRFKGGPQDVVQDSKYLEREKHQFKTYFKEVSQTLKNADQIVIFGPAEAGEKLNKELHENYQNISQKVKAVITTDSMTDNQIKAFVKDYFQKK